MTKLIAGMTTSLDGFVADASGDLGPLYQDMEALQGSDYIAETIAETGAVIMGRRTFDAAGDPDAYAEGYEYQVPIFVLTHHPPERHPREAGGLRFRFLDDLDAAVAHARAAAGDRDVTVVGGADVIGQLLAAGHVDELQVDVVPVVLGTGLRLFPDGGPTPEVALEGVRQVGDRTCLRYRVG